MSHGGYREGSGRAKTGYYKGIYCGSTYELCWVIHAIDHNIEFQRFPNKLEKDGVIYYPDFLLSDGNTIIEPKGYEKQESVDKKTKVAESFGYIVKVMRKEDLQYAFDYVIRVYGTKKFFDLYDEYKPRYTYICGHCQLSFSRDKQLRSETGFCNRSCAGKYRKRMNCTELGKMTDEIKAKVSVALLGKKYKSYTRKNKQIWITDGKANTRIVEGENMPNGFKRGRITSH